MTRPTDATGDGEPSPEGPAITRREFGRSLGALAVAGTVSPDSGAFMHADEPNVAPSQSSSGADELTFLSATELAARLRRKDLSARDVMAAHLARIERVNPKVNAIVTLVAERAMADAARADETMARSGPIGVLHGLPAAHKDLVETAGIRTTRGSPFFRDFVPTQDAPIVTRMRHAGALTLGKTNTPEMGAGSQTFNTIFGATRNPYDVTRTCGGSSGGAAVALACGLVPIADGSDTGGSLRNPAAFCNVVGLRPSPGRVVRGDPSWSPLSVAGPMARTVADVALFLSVLAAPEPRSPLWIADDGERFAASLNRSFKGVRVAWWRELGGIPIDPEIRRVIDAHRQTFIDLGCSVEEAEPDFSGVDQAFQTLRYVSNHPQYSAMVQQRPEWVKDTIKFEVAQAERLTAVDVGRALARQGKMYEDSRRFFTSYDYFVLPVTQVSPFSVETPYPTEIGGVKMADYIDWMRSCWYVTLMSNPAISVPAGWTSSGLPIGIQIVGRHRDELSVLQLAHAFEQATGFGKRRPPVA